MPQTKIYKNDKERKRASAIRRKQEAEAVYNTCYKTDVLDLDLIKSVCTVHTSHMFIPLLMNRIYELERIHKEHK